jgi:SH3-like domain-containing protein
MFFILSLFFCLNLCSECIIQDGVKLRSRPSKRAPITWQVRKYFPFKKLKNQTKYWTQILDLHGKKHWVPKMYYTKRYHCVIVKSDETRIKQEPKLGAKDKFQESAFKYETFKFISARRGWIQVEDVHGDTGWIMYKDVWVD